MAVNLALAETAERRESVRLVVRGIVQGVGFRPFVYRAARDLGLAGFVANTPAGVVIEVEGSGSAIARLIETVRSPPGHAAVTDVAVEATTPRGEVGFAIRQSDLAGRRRVVVLPDLAACPACLAEVFDPGDRRYRYPFTNCTQCGPRYSIVTDLPYDRDRTTMRGFAMCAACCAEYDDPEDRRFHAEPNACPACGPRLAWRHGTGRSIAEENAALVAAADALRGGAIVAVKGLGGFHLMVDARDESAVRRLRERKRRPDKPFAVMMPSRETVAAACRLDPLEAALLTGPEQPIVLLRRRNDGLADAVAPGNPLLGVMLPYTPLHHLLMAELGFAVVATSGNVSDEPIVTDETEALTRLAGLADGFLVHDRPIARPLDDSIARVVAGRPQLLRRARGYAPATVAEDGASTRILALGGHLKSTIALSTDAGIVLSQHIGDLDTGRARDVHADATADLARLYGITPEQVACDLHPDYHSSRVALQFGLPVTAVQHHLAHVMAVVGEHDLALPVLGVAFDGTGYGPDGTIWGGEFIHVGPNGWRRVAHLRPFRLPGGQAAIREPRRAALGLLCACYGTSAAGFRDLPSIAAFTRREAETLALLAEKSLQAPLSTSAGRLFDAAASLAGVCQRSTYEGQAAAALEWAMDETDRGEPYTFSLTETRPSMIIDWRPAIDALLADVRAGVDTGAVSARFHRGLAAAIVAVAAAVGEARVVLTGGCFQNARLTEMVIDGLAAAGMIPVWPQRIPPNDGGLAFGQAVAVGRGMEEGERPCA